MKETIFKVPVKASNLNHGVAKKGKLHRRKSSTYLISFLSIESSTSLKDISYTYHLFPKISVLVLLNCTLKSSSSSKSVSHGVS
jgi:hypothetical protein